MSKRRPRTGLGIVPTPFSVLMARGNTPVFFLLHYPVEHPRPIFFFFFENTVPSLFPSFFFLFRWSRSDVIVEEQFTRNARGPSPRGNR